MIYLVKQVSAQIVNLTIIDNRDAIQRFDLLDDKIGRLCARTVARHRTAQVIDDNLSAAFGKGNCIASTKSFTILRLYGFVYYINEYDLLMDRVRHTPPPAPVMITTLFEKSRRSADIFTSAACKLVFFFVFLLF